MEIIKNGDSHKKDTTFVCYPCGCEFVAHGNEYSFKTVESFMLGREIFVAYCNCPDCGEECTKRVEKINSKESEED